MDLSSFETKEMKNRRLKEHIFNVALSMMRQIGFDNITIRMICTEAGISTGMFYKHFSSKEDILAFYYDKAEADFDAAMNRNISSLPLQQQLVEFYVWVCGYTAELGVDFCRNFFNSKNKRMNTQLFHNKMMAYTTYCIDEAVKGGFTLSEGRKSEAVSKDLCVMVKGIIFDWSAHEGSYDMAEFAKNLLNRCIDALL